MMRRVIKPAFGKSDNKMSVETDSGNVFVIVQEGSQFATITVEFDELIRALGDIGHGVQTKPQNANEYLRTLPVGTVYRVSGVGYVYEKYSKFMVRGTNGQEDSLEDGQFASGLPASDIQVIDQPAEVKPPAPANVNEVVLSLPVGTVFYIDPRTIWIKSAEDKIKVAEPGTAEVNINRYGVSTPPEKLTIIYKPEEK